LKGNENPVQIPAPIAGKLHQELLLVAVVSDSQPLMPPKFGISTWKLPVPSDRANFCQLSAD
jgi:hypothetical protein